MTGVQTCALPIFTQAKDAFDWSNEDLESRFIEKLKEESYEFKQKSENLRIREKVNSDDVVKQLTNDLANNDKIQNIQVSIKKEQNIDEVEDAETDDLFEVEAQSNIDQLVDEGGILNESAGVGVDIEDNSPLQIKLTYNGNDYDFTFIFDDKNPKSEWLKVGVEDKQINKYAITLNIRHSFFFPFIQKKDFLVLLAKFAIAIVIAEINAYEIATDGLVSPSSIRNEMGRILEDLRKTYE